MTPKVRRCPNTAAAQQSKRTKERIRYRDPRSADFPYTVANFSYRRCRKNAMARLSLMWQYVTDSSAGFAAMSVHERVEEVYNAERNNIYSYLLYFGVPSGRAQELAHDSFLKLYLKLSKGELIENPRAWLYRVAHNSALRFHQREPVFDDLDPDFPARVDVLSPEGAMIERQRRSVLLQAIQELS